MTRLVSYIKNIVERNESEGRDRFIFHDVGTVKRVSSGRGLVYSWVEGVSETALVQSQFVMSQDAPAGYALDKNQITIEFDTLPKFPACGIITSAGEGFAIVPALKLDVSKGKNIVLMVLSPRTKPLQLSAENNILTIPKEESAVTVSTDGGELRCLGTIAGRSKTARIIINRNPHLPVYRGGFNETLSTLKGRGRLCATWRPVARNFEELVLVFYPSRMIQFNPDSLSLEKIATQLGFPADTSAERSGDFVLGDGPGVEYTLRLKMGFGLRRYDSVESRLTIS